MNQSDIRPIDPTKSVAFEVTGKISFICCGKRITSSGECLKHVLCPICNQVYDFSLLPRHTAPEILPVGLQVVIKNDVTIKLGSQNIILSKGMKFLVGSDPHGVLGTLENQVLLEVSPDKSTSFLLFPVSISDLEPNYPEVEDGSYV